jgi:hypothetical protein
MVVQGYLLVYLEHPHFMLAVAEAVTVQHLVAMVAGAVVVVLVLLPAFPVLLILVAVVVVIHRGLTEAPVAQVDLVLLLFVIQIDIYQLLRTQVAQLSL